jgi:hypothetical protein
MLSAVKPLRCTGPLRLARGSRKFAAHAQFGAEMAVAAPEIPVMAVLPLSGHPDAIRRRENAARRLEKHRQDAEAVSSGQKW